MENALVPFEKQMTLADAFCRSGLFGLKSKEQALSLMALCEAEHMHPAIAIRDYHLITVGGVTKPSLKADAMLARFQQAGGSVKWGQYSDTAVSGAFTHDRGGSVTITWTTDMAKRADLTKNPTWSKYPRQMLRARVISEGIRTVYPACVCGVYTPEEVEDMAPVAAPSAPRYVEAEVVDPVSASAAMPPPATAETVAASTLSDDHREVAEDELGRRVVPTPYWKNWLNKYFNAGSLADVPDAEYDRLMVGIRKSFKLQDPVENSMTGADLAAADAQAERSAPDASQTDLPF